MTETSEQQRPSNLKYTLLCGAASFIASFISNVTHPLQVIKTRFQSHDGSHNKLNVVPKYQGIYPALKTIYKHEGFQGLYKGFFVNFISQSSSQVLFFTIYQSRLRYLSEKKQQKFMSAVGQASFEASLLATFITQPLWTIRTRMLLTTKKINEKDNFMQCGRELYRQYGIKGFGRGLGISLVASMSGFIQMNTFEGCKMLFESIRDEKDDGSLGSYVLGGRTFLAGGMAKFVSSLLMHPLTTVRTRLQQEQYLNDSKKPKYQGNYDIVVKLVKEEGVRGFYKGFYANLIKGFLQRGIYFYCYELMKKVMDIQRKPHERTN